MAKRTGKGPAEAPDKFYDLLRDEAREMGHPAAKLPDETWDKYARANHKRNPLKESKMYIKAYMNGRIDPAMLAQFMAEDDKLRYTISDICRARLEPVDIDIQHNGKYIDMTAGLKTFWAEMHAPLPSEVETARDLRNIYFGVEAGRAAAQKEHEKLPEEVPKKKGLRERIQGFRSGKDSDLDEDKKTMRERIREGRQSLMQKAAQKAVDKLTPIAERRQDVVKEPQHSRDTEQYDAAMQRRAAQNLENLVSAVEMSGDSNYHPNQRANALVSAGVAIENVEDIMSRSEGLSLEDGTFRESDDSLFSESDAAAAGLGIPSARPEAGRSGYSADELGRPMSSEMAELLDQISSHVRADQGRDRVYNAAQGEPKQSDELGKTFGEYVVGDFEGESVRFKGSWAGHTFTNDEVSSLLDGESITFTYTNRDNEEKTVSGKLERQRHEGREFVGFKADFDKKQEADATEQSIPVEGPEEEYHEPDISFEELGSMFGDFDMEADIEAYESMKREDEIVLTDDDMSALEDFHENNMMAGV